jgi:hypothetical protein
VVEAVKFAGGGELFLRERECVCERERTMMKLEFWTKKNTEGSDIRRAPSMTGKKTGLVG